VHLHKKFQKIRKFIALVGAYPKTAKAKIWPLRTLGVKMPILKKLNKSINKNLTCQLLLNPTTFTFVLAPPLSPISFPN
jgi:hypothetical protein